MSLSAAFSLPQPPLVAGQAQRGRRPYKYVPYDVLESDWLGDPRRLLSSAKYGGRNHKDKFFARYAPGTLVWVLLSKGKPKQPAHNAQSGYNALALHRKRRDKKHKGMPNNSFSDKHGKQGNEKSDDQTKESIDTYSQNNKGQKSEINNTSVVPLNQSRKDFFLRARVLSDDETIKSNAGDGEQSTSIQERNERRILVRYSKGSTYRVRAYNLIPILEPSVHNIDRLPEAFVSQQNEEEDAPQSRSMALPPLVILVPETNIYRRIAKVHTTPDDSFMEIGCDYGITVNKIQKSLEEAGDVPKVWPPKDGNRASDCLGEPKEAENKKVYCLGVDKSKESIDIANERYPKCRFSLGNILVKEEMSSIRALCEQALVNGAPSIICIDVNGNREISGVLECLRRVINEAWKRQPRMIIVKSRFLYWELKNTEGVGVDVH